MARQFVLSRTLLLFLMLLILMLPIGLPVLSPPPWLLLLLPVAIFGALFVLALVHSESVVSHMPHA